jgi:Protein of unknown function (DUF1571)
MARLFLVLPLCLFLAPAYPQESGALQIQEQVLPIHGGPLPDADPFVFVNRCLERYDREVRGYSAVLYKQERIDGRLYPPEKVQVYFKEQPFSVFMRWLHGARKAQCALYVEGQNGNKVLALPYGLLGHLGVFEKSPTGEEANQSGRYPISEFGLKKGTERVLKHWRVARAQEALHVEYLGLYRVPEAGDRDCYKIRRTRYSHPEDNGVTELTLYIDRETWLQVGSVLRGAEGQLIAEYFFRDVRVNPEFTADQFMRSALKP